MVARLAPLVLVVLVAPACALRDQPYRFRAPLVGAVRPDDHAGPSRAARTPPVRREVPPPITAAAQALAAAPPAELRLAVPRPRPIAASASLADRLRDQVGTRRADDSLAFALAMLAGEGGFDREVAALEHPGALIELARERAAELDRPPRAGDLLVFDPVGRPSAVVAVAVATEDGTTEMVFLARGVVRRGYVTPASPRATRASDGRALNTFVRARESGDRNDARYLAGELLRASIDRDRLLGRPTQLAGR